jgi:predicted oxidoreductase
MDLKTLQRNHKAPTPAEIQAYIDKCSNSVQAAKQEKINKGMARLFCAVGTRERVENNYYKEGEYSYGL